MFRKSKRLFLSLLIIFILTVFYGINYSIPDIEAYFIPAFICSFIFMSIGLARLFELIKSRIKPRIIALTFRGIFLGLFILPLAVNFKPNDNSRNQLAYIVADSVLESAAPNAVIITDNWDIYAPSLYLMHHENIRADIILIDKELLRRGWYYDYLNKCYPEFYESCEEQIETFRKKLYPFEHRLSYDPNVIQRAFVNLLNALLLNNYYDNPPYLTQNKLLGDYTQVAPKYNRVPEGLLYRLKMSDNVERVDDDFMFANQLFNTETLKLSAREMMFYRLFPQMLYQRGIYYAQNLIFDEALKYFLHALRYERNRASLYVALGGAYAGLNRVEEAKNAFQNALALEPNNYLALENLRRVSAFLPGGPKVITTEIR